MARKQLLIYIWNTVAEYNPAIGIHLQLDKLPIGKCGCGYVISGAFNRTAISWRADSYCTHRRVRADQNRLCAAECAQIIPRFDCDTMWTVAELNIGVQQVVQRHKFNYTIDINLDGTDGPVIARRGKEMKRYTRIAGVAGIDGWDRVDDAADSDRGRLVGPEVGRVWTNQR